MHFCHSVALRLLAVALPLHTAPFTLHTSAQRPPAQPHAAEILHRMQKLNVLGSVLYIVAHPDDENTKLIAWLANGKKVRTGNLSLTRGDGGQNLIGPELGDALGIIRTQELMEARRIDGGEQFFTRAVDFGYSKTAEESFEKWGKQEVLSDVVRVIRMFRPDIIITRFSSEPGPTHGHHTASAILAEEAFDLAGNPKAFPEQLEQGLEVWQPRRLFFNGSSWWRRDLDEVAKTDPDWFTVDVGGYDPLLGLSYTEIAGRSRSMHKSQGFGAAETRGESLEYLKLIKGDRPKTKDIFEGIDMTWGRVKGGDTYQRIISDMIANYDPQQPERSTGSLLKLYPDYFTKPSKDEREAWRHIDPDKIQDLLIACNGLALEATMDAPTIATSDDVRFRISGLNRRTGPIRAGGGFDTVLVTNVRFEYEVMRPRTSEWDQPYWLRAPHGDLHLVNETVNAGRSLIGKPVTGQTLVNAWELFFESGSPKRLITPLTYKWVDRVDGERIRPVYVTPVASVIPKSDVLIATGGPQTITVEVEALTDSLTGQLNVTLPAGWATTKDLKLVDIAKRNERQSFTFQLMPGDNAQAGPVKFEFNGPKGKADRTLHEIDYPHIMPQVYYTPAEVKLVPLDVKTTAKRVGYVKGAGDDVPQAMEQLGVVVEFIEPGTAMLEELRKYDAIVTGIRAYNATKGMKQLHPLLLKYVEEGGTLIVQYNTTPRFFSGASDFQIDPATLGPHPFTIGRGRVTVEEAPPTFLDPNHALLNTPNKITAADFEGWVQERGLYFADEFAPHYTPLIAWNDPGEEPLNGALIVADHGKGRFVYTGISFFRQLPAGVGGAYRLWGNMISPRVSGRE